MGWGTTGRGRLRSAGLTAVLAGLLAAPVPPVAADPYPSVGDVRSARAQAEAAAGEVERITAVLAGADDRLERAGVRAAVKVEAYEGAVHKLRLSEQRAAAAQRAHAQSLREAEAANDALARLAIASYRGGGELAAFSAMLGASGPNELLQRAAMVDQLQRRKQAILTRRQEAEAAAQRHARAAEALAAAQQRAVIEAERAKAQAAAVVAALRQQRAAIETQRQRLNTALVAAQRHASTLSRERQAAIEAARRDAERRAQANRTSTGPIIYVGGRVERVMKYARAQLGKPYEWAADGPDTYDCSGLTMRAWEQAGVRLPHWSVAQYEQSQKVSLSRLRVGDLVFFAEDKRDYRTIYHVGVYAGDGQMIEAPYTGENIRYSSIYRASLFGAARP